MCWIRCLLLSSLLIGCFLIWLCVWCWWYWFLLMLIVKKWWKFCLLQCVAVCWWLIIWYWKFFWWICNRGFRFLSCVFMLLRWVIVCCYVMRFISWFWLVFMFMVLICYFCFFRCVWKVLMVNKWGECWCLWVKVVRWEVCKFVCWMN